MDRKDIEVLKKIKEYCDSISEYTSNINSAVELQHDRKTMSATVFEIMQIGELSKVDLSDEAKSALKEIPWKQIYGMRNRIVHGYGGINPTILFETAKDDIPVLSESICTVLDK